MTDRKRRRAGTRWALTVISSRQQPVERAMQIRQGCAFDRTVVISAGQRDYALLASIGVNYQSMKTRRNHLIFLRQQKNGGSMDCFRVRNAVEVPWNLQGNRAREQ